MGFVVRIWICGLGFEFDGLVAVLAVQREARLAI
jgi:hypothetical protein